MQDGNNHSGGLEEDVNTGTGQTGQTFTDQKTRQERGERIDAMMDELGLTGNSSTKAVLEDVLRGIGDYNSALRDKTVFTSNPVVRAAYRIGYDLGFTSPEKQLQKQREGLEQKAQNYDRIIARIKERREELQRAYLDLQDRRDKALEVRALLKEEIGDATMRVDKMKENYPPQQAGEPRSEGERSAGGLRQEYHTLELYIEQRTDALKSVNQEILRAEQLVEQKRSAIDFMTYMKDQAAFVKARRVGNVLIATGDTEPMTGAIVDVARLTEETDREIGAYAGNVDVLQKATAKLEGLAHIIADPVRARNGNGSSHYSADTKRDKRMGEMKQAYEQMDDSVEQLTHRLRTEALL